MRNVRMFVATLVVFSIATLASAQVTVGFLPNNALLNSVTNAVLSVTYIDLAHRASANGTVSTLTTEWASGFPGCANGFRLRFLHSSDPLSNAYTTVAERGPFALTASGGFVTVALTPAVTVQQGDFLAIVVAPGCGGINEGQTSWVGSMKILADIPANGTLNGILQNAAISARASSDPNVLDGIVTAVGSVAGANGSNFRSSLQLSNGLPDSIQGKLVFHPAGASASPGDPSLNYTLPPFGSIAYPDVVAALGASGLGSLDVVSNSSAAPLATARVFNDLGAGGTSGFTETIMNAVNVLGAADYAYISVPADLTNYRMNIGIRTLAAGASIAVAQFDSNGNKLAASIIKNYGPSYFEQVPLATFLGAQPVANGQIRIVPSSGQIIVYGSTTDNRTNDSAIVFGSRP